jgi:hypothetical protein
LRCGFHRPGRLGRITAGVLVNVSYIEGEPMETKTSLRPVETAPSPYRDGSGIVLIVGGGSPSPMLDASRCMIARPVNVRGRARDRGRRGNGQPLHDQDRQAQRAGVMANYRYPSGCLGERSSHRGRRRKVRGPAGKVFGREGAWTARCPANPSRGWTK